MAGINGKWKGAPSCVFGLKEYMEAGKIDVGIFYSGRMGSGIGRQCNFEPVGLGDKFDAWNQEFVMVARVEGDRLIFDTKMEGNPAVVKNVEPGRMVFFPGVGLLEAECHKEGDTFISRANLNDQPLVRKAWLQGETLHCELICDNVRATMQCQRA